jgi:hypothetical protein
LAASLRDELKQRQIEPLNLLAAILQEGTIRAAEIARAAGVTRGEVLRAINKEAVEGRKRPAATDPFTASPSWGRTTLVLALAKLQAWSRGAPSVATEDILAALVIEDQAVVGGEIPEIHQYPDLLARLSARADTPFFTPDIAARLLRGLAAFQGVLAEESARESRNRCVGIASPELLLQPPPPYALIPMSEGTSRVFHLAANLRAEIQPLHLLAAIMEDESNCCTRLVREVGITREKVVQHLREAI